MPVTRKIVLCHRYQRYAKTQSMNFECQDFITAIFVQSCTAHTGTEGTRNHFSLSAFAPGVIRSLDTVSAQLLFSPAWDRPHGNTKP